MIGAIKKAFRKFFPSKHERDVKRLKPIVEEINRIYETLQGLSNDELRSKTQEFKAKIKERTKPITDEIKQLQKQIDENPDMPIDKMEELYKKIDELKKKELEVIEEVLNEILPEAFAVVKETARRFKENKEIIVTATDHDRSLAGKGKDYIRIEGDKAIYKNEWRAAGIPIKWDMVHFDVQLMGGIVLHEGKIAEMATGEGKTLVATLPLYLNALAEKGVHLVTVNDFLARRDAEWMGPIFEFLGLTVDVINIHPPHSPERRAAYRADITYGTASEFGFDYLRDNMVRLPEERVQRELHYAIVDEIDSILIDDARTPLIISGPAEQTDDIEEYYRLKPRVVKLVEAQKKLAQKLIKEAKEALQKGDDKKAGLALLRLKRGLPKYRPFLKLLQEPGVQTLLIKTENYYLQDNAREMPKVDEELYFVIDERNNTVDLTDKGIDLITGQSEDPNMFILPDLGTLMAEIENSNLSPEEKQKKKDQTLREYAAKAQRLHILQQLLRAYTLFERDVDYVVMDGQVKIVDENTGRILEGRRYSEGLHQAIEAKENVKVEGDTQTYATITLQNYFRMYHKLAGMTGTAETESAEFWEIYKLDVVVIPTHKPVIREDKEDLVFKTKREKYNAIIEEIERLHKQGRPVLVGTTSVEVSELLSRMLKRKGIPHNVLNAKHHQREAEIIAQAGQKGAVTIATNMAGRGTDIKLGPGVAELGGLAVIGTEHHDARRIDRQLRGRAGRQGDPGSSQFFVSLEDDLMRLFGSERIAKLLDRLGYQEGEPLQHPMITRSIERAQKKVEENNFGIRKRLLEYDNVMNVQREAIYTRRKHALYGDRLTLDIYNTFKDVAYSIIERFKDLNDYEGLKQEVIRTFSINPPFSEEEFKNQKVDTLAEKLFQEAYSTYQRKKKQMAEKLYPAIRELYLAQGDKVRRVIIPFTDGIRVVEGIVDLKKAYDTKGEEIANAFERAITLALIDDYWKTHLREMDHLKQAVQTAAYEQKDPLLVYKFEAFELFKDMLYKMNKDITAFLMRGDIMAERPPQQQQAPKPQPINIRTGRGAMPEPAMPTPPPPTPQPVSVNPQVARQQRRPRRAMPRHPNMPPQPVEPIRKGKKIGRNDPCPCGSGKKYKHCHGRFA